MTKERGDVEATFSPGKRDLRALFQAAPDPYLVLDKNLCVVAVNWAYLQVTMTRSEAIAGQSVFELFPQSPGLPDSEGVGSLVHSLKRVLELRTSDVMEVQKYQIRLPEEKGGGVEERFWSTVNTPVFDADGEVAFIITRVEDVTELTRLKKQEESRREEETRLASYPILNPNPVIEFAPDGSVLFSNPAAERLGRRLGQGGATHPLLPPDLKMLMRELKGGMPCISREQEVKGEIFEQSICLGSHGDALRIYAMDITSRKRVEREREELLLKLESVLESINEGVVISDLEGNLLTMNQEALRLHRFEGVEEIRSRYEEYQEMLELHAIDGTLLAPDQWPLGRAIRGEKFVDCEVQVTNRKKGVSRFLSYSGAPVRQKSSEKVILAVITFRDITEAKRMEAELRIATAQLSTITEHLPIAVTRCDAERRYRWVSPEFSRWLGKPVEEISGRLMTEVLGEHAYRTLLPFVEKVLAGERVEFDLPVSYNGRGKRWVTGIYTPIRDLAGRVDGWVGVIFDVTERKQLEEQIRILNRNLETRVSELEDANQELAAFNHMVSHDLRRPLNTIGTSCQALEMLCGNIMNDECREYVRIAMNNVSGMSALIEALLKFSRSTQGELRREPVDLGEMARKVIRDVVVTEPHRKVSFVIAEPMEVLGDPNLLQSVMENLIGNAWKYTHGREEALIEIGSIESGGETAYYVRDNGPGFDMSFVDQLFLPFKRLPEAQSVRGFGIGLATVDRIVRRHGGRVWAEGTPGKGATFYFTLPQQAG
jgi:PAS domain S-box-containing protein